MTDFCETIAWKAIIWMWFCALIAWKAIVSQIQYIKLPGDALGYGLLPFAFPLPLLCLCFAFALPFLSARDLWFSQRPLVQGVPQLLVYFLFEHPKLEIILFIYVLLSRT